jgi:Flp pilus assembly protein TadB
MIKPVLQLAAVGLVGVVLWKVAAGLLLPLIFVLFKVALIVGLIMFAFWFFRKDRGKEDTPPASS